MRAVLGGLLLILLASCATVVNRATDQFAADLEASIRAHDDPATIASALPAYLLLLESRLQSRPDDARLRLSTARLTSTYATLLADRGDPDSIRRLTARALGHARHGACVRDTRFCALQSRGFEDLEQDLARPVTGEQLEAAYVLGTMWVGWIAAHSGDFSALVDLPKAELLLESVAAASPEHDHGMVWLYLAVLHSQRPPAVGGQTARALRYFDRAREISGGQNLLIDVMMADSYARLLFDRALYVELLEQVLESRVNHPDYQLVNQLARQRAADLLNETEAVFD